MDETLKSANEALPLDEKAEAWITERWGELKNAYIIYHQNCWESFLHYVGESWNEWNAQRKVFVPIEPEDAFVPKPRINKFSPTIDSIVSNFNTAPDIEAVVKESLVGDVRAAGIAEIANAIGAYFMQENGLVGAYKNESDKVGAAAQIFVLCGNVFTVVMPRQIDTLKSAVMQDGVLQQIQCYVCNFMDEVEQPSEVCPKCGGPLSVKPVNRQVPTIDPATGQPQIQESPVYKVECEIGNPLFFFPRPGSTRMGEGDGATPYMMIAVRMPLDRIHELWGIEAEADNEFADGYNVTYEHALSYYYVGFSNSGLTTRDSCLVKYAFLEPGKVKDFPDGLYAVMINNKVIEAAPLYERTSEYPLTKAGYLSVPTLFFDRSVAFDLVNIAKEANRYESLIALHGMTAAVDPIVIDENTVVSEITGRADKLIKWRSIGPGSREPHRMEHGSLDEGVYKKLEQLYAEFEHISGAVSVYRGQQPGSVTAASAIEDLKSQAEQMFSRPVQSWNQLWAETVRKGVVMIRKKYTIAQVTEILGPDHQQKIADFMSANLDTILDWKSTTMGLPRTRAERMKEMMTLFDKGALDIRDPAVRQNVFELFGDTGMMSQFSADATRARYENKMMLQGKPAVVMPEIEDLDVHFSIHAEAIKSLEFENWPPQAKQLLMEHAIQTKQALIAMQAPAPGLAPGKLQPSKPGGSPPTGGPSAPSA